MSHNSIFNTKYKHYDVGNTIEAGRIAQYWDKKLKFPNSIYKEKRTEHYYFDTSKALEKLDLYSIEFGNWTNQQDRSDMLYAMVNCIEELASFYKLPLGTITLKGQLSIALGARGSGSALAHYEKHKRCIINITKPHADAGSFTHEYTHAIDNIAGVQLAKSPFLSELTHQGSIFNPKFKDYDAINAKGLRLKTLQIIHKLIYNTKGLTTFGKVLKKYHESDPQSYWIRTWEILARTNEAFLATQIKRDNKMLVHSRSHYTNSLYPDLKLINLVGSDLYDVMREAISNVNGVPVEKTVKPIINIEPEPKPKPEPKPQPKPEPKPQPKPKKATVSKTQAIQAKKYISDIANDIKKIIKNGTAVKTYDEWEVNNLHSENILLLAMTVGNSSDVNKAKQILFQRDALGGRIRDDAWEIQKELNRKLYPKFKDKYMKPQPKPEPKPQPKPQPKPEPKPDSKLDEANKQMDELMAMFKQALAD